MARPVIGIMASRNLVDDQYLVDMAGRQNAAALAEVAGGLPLLIPAEPGVARTEDLLAACSGFLFPGGRANVHPDEYGHTETEAHGTFDRGRDAVALSLIRAAVERGQPVLGVCRGFQEVAVAFGSTLHPEIRDLPGRMNHRMPPDGSLEEKFALRHDVTLVEGGVFHALFGSTVVRTNTLHGQGIMEPGARVIVEGTAPDGTPEAIRIDRAPGFALGVQWHAEWNADGDAVSRPLFEAFGEAARAWARGERPKTLRSA
ncbi:MAG: gamma-glutamyl-gamma-aminobutyrate hydrolase family protein [Paracoccaceae bacterium]|nr:gamma-glutamyl-gamma-aminobutyrate hydrolase family protein [Paracoccaceae bacterium]